jgi:hypothetical protein
MPIPMAGPDGLLPPGLYDCSLDEIQGRFGVFQKTDRRPRLFEKLRQFLTEVQQTGLVAAVVVNGSFITATPEPNDIDLILLVEPGHDFSAELRPPEYNVLSRRQVRKRHGLDVLVAREGSAAAARYQSFFHRVRDRPEVSKGLLRVSLRPHRHEESET